MKVRVLRNTVIEGSVTLAGEMVEISKPELRSLEEQGLVERVNQADHEDTMEVRYGVKETQNFASVRDILVFTPVMRLEDETVQAVLDLEWHGSISWILQRDNPLECVDPSHNGKDRQNGIYNHLHQFERGRETFLRGRYDAMLIVESDVIPPKNALIRLTAVLDGTWAHHDAPLQAAAMDVAYGVYRFRASEVINVYELYPGNPRNVGESLSLHPHLLRRAVKLGVYPCSGAGFGCTLIRREVLEQIPFRLESNVSVHCDTPWIQDVLRAGFKSAADFGVVCGHKDSDGTILWPGLGETQNIASLKEHSGVDSLQE